MTVRSISSGVMDSIGVIKVLVAFYNKIVYNNNMKQKTKYRDQKTGRYISSPASRSQQLYSELYRAFDIFNATFAEDKLPNVVITIQESGRRNAYGWFGNGFWKDNLVGDSVPEINLSAEYLSRGADCLLETLLHEMAHLWNACVEKVSDCSGGQYHNKKFKVAAEKFGLIVERSGTRGWSHTKLDQPAIDAIKKVNADESLFNGLRRKSVKKTHDRYFSLIVNSSYKERLKSVVETSALSQREFVETALEHMLTQHESAMVKTGESVVQFATAD